MGEIKLNGGVIFITTILLFHLFKNSQPAEKWGVSFKNFSGNVNASGVVTCQCPQIYL